MAYDDTPMYMQNRGEDNRSATGNRSQLPWADTVKVGYKSGSSPSPIAVWYHAENSKRVKGLENEIDRNEIMLALKGVRNRWTDRVNEQRQRFEDYLDEKIAWEHLASKPTQ